MSGGNCPGGNCPGGNCPRTHVKQELVENLSTLNKNICNNAQGKTFGHEATLVFVSRKISCCRNATNFGDVPLSSCAFEYQISRHD